MLSVNPASSGSSASSATDNSNIAAFVSQNTIGILSVPGSPTSVVAVSGNTSLAVTWVAPTNTGGSAITDYQVKYSSNGGSTWTNFFHPVSTMPSLTVTGLTNGTPYVIKVLARNADGISLPSANSAPVTPAATVPGSPTSVVTVSLNTSLAVAWTAPTNTGGSAITDYQVKYSNNNGVAGSWILFTDPVSTATSVIVTGLTNGIAYVIKVLARNAVGISLPSANSALVTAGTVPGRPTSVVAFNSNTSLAVTWIAPDSTGGSPIRDYLVQYSSNNGSTWTRWGKTTVITATSCTVTGLTKGTAYVIRVYARNAVGISLPSANSAPSVTVTVPGRPTSVVAVSGNTSLAVTWVAPTNTGGSAITDYQVKYSSNGGSTWTNFVHPVSTMPSLTVTGLTNGTPYVIKVIARNAVAFSLPSANSAPATPTFMPMVTVGNAGNAADTNTGSLYGAVSYAYQIGAYDVTGSQYTAFLNAVGSTDTYALYNANMGTDTNVAQISQSGTSGSYTYAVMNSTGNRPVTYVTWFDCVRFSNWMSNGQPSGAQNSTTTENGAYNVNGATSGNAVAKNLTNPNTGSAPTFRVPLENEWYKAAYYSPNYGGSGVGGYYAFATQSDTDPGTTIGSTANQANYDGEIGTATDVGSFSGSGSFYGTFDQTGNVFELNDLDGTAGSSRGYRGGDWHNVSYFGLSSWRNDIFEPIHELNHIGFRLASPV